MKLSPEILKQNAGVFLAFIDGKPIEYRHRELGWVSTHDMSGIESWEYRLAPDPIAPGHNPDRLTVSQVGEGWRLLDRDEALWYIQNNKQASQTEYWPAYQGHWHRFFDDKSPIGKTETYRTRLTREELAALDKPSAPVMVPWDSPEDVPGPVCWIRKNKTYFGAMVIGLIQDGIVYTNGEGITEATWSKLADTKAEYSTDRKEWKPCTKEKK